MYSFPSASQILAPSPLAATTGSPPTPRKARTGEFTPPGNRSRDLRRISAERSAAIGADCRHGKIASCRPGECQGRARDAGDERRLEIVIIDDFDSGNVREFTRLD